MPLVSFLFIAASTTLSLVSLLHHRLDLSWRALHSSDAFQSFAFWRLVATATLLHSSWHHLLPNLAIASLLAPSIERRIGSLQFLVFLVITTLAPTGIELLASGRPQIGISGIDYAFVGFLLVNPPAIRRSTWLTFAGALVAWLVAGIVFPISPDNPPGNFSHSSGLILGLLVGLFYRYVSAAGSAPNPSLQRKPLG